jgi:hypothetical protein
MTGNGLLTSIRVTGPNKQREAIGEDAFLYWVIELKDYDGSQIVEKLSPVTYGVVPAGFIQVYPEQGTAPQLVEGERYYLRIVTTDANGVRTSFTIQDGKAVEDDR